MDDREKKEAENQYPDGGYGWVIVGAICLINVSLLTLVPCFGLIFKDEFKQWGVSSAQTSFLLHLQNSLFCLFGFFSSPCLKIYGMRRVSLVGAFMMSVGIFLTSFATSYAYLIFSTSVLIGIGQGIAMPATYLATYTYFKKRLTIALSLTVTSASLSSIVLPKICDKLLAQIGRKYVVLVLFALSLLSFIGCGLLKPVKKKQVDMAEMKPEVTKELLPNDQKHSNKVYQSTTTVKPQNDSVLAKIFKVFDLQLLKDVPLVIMIIGLGVSFASELNIILMLQFILEKLSLFERSDIATACAPKDFCANTTSNSTVCKSCTDYNNCNLDLSLTDEATLCIQCTSEDDPECAKDDMNSAKVKEYCRLLDDSKNCVAYKFINGLTGNLSTYRGCASTGYCEDAALSNNKTVCNECSGNICNKKIDTTKQQTLCVQCRGPNCDTNLNLSTTKYCGIDSKKKEECVAYTTLEGTKTVTVRGCEAQGFCEDAATSSERKACKSCNDANICNSNLDLKDEKVLCVQCSSETDENCALDVMDPNKIKKHCKLDSNKNECIAYKYLDMKSNKKIIVRGCIAKEACANLPISMQYCSECTSDICNLNVVPVTTTTSTVSPTQSPGGAPSMTNLDTSFLILLASVSILA